MNIYLELFLTFFKIGAVTFGGGYAMIPLVQEAALGFGITEDAFLNFIAVAESTPGPIAINMATFIGSIKGGFFGSVCATFGVVLPSFIIILLIVAILNNLVKYTGVQAALKGIRPVALALILFISNLFNFEFQVGNQTIDLFLKNIENKIDYSNIFFTIFFWN